jgi:HEAT repeat protein
MIAMILTICGAAPVPPAPPPPTVAEVRAVAPLACPTGAPADRRRLQAVLDRGTAAFPAYEAILADPASTHDDLEGVLNMVRRTDAPKERFLPLVVPLLAHRNWSMRRSAILLLEQIGTPEEGSILIALLSDEAGNPVRSPAARALAATGGRRELIAMDLWLRSAAINDPNDTTLLDHVKECRDKLEMRLKESPPPKDTK